MKSKKYKMRKAVLDLKTCIICRKLHGKLYDVSESLNEERHHHNCRCIFEYIKSIIAGKATNKGIDGADWWLKHIGIPPQYYITYEEAISIGWKASLGNLSLVAKGKMLTKGIYKNRNRHLPHVEGRIWYEADINYTGGYRNGERILFSNDGLIFITLDHYLTFIEII